MIAMITHRVRLADPGPIGKIRLALLVAQAPVLTDELSLCAAPKCASSRESGVIITTPIMAIGTLDMGGGIRARSVGMTAMTIPPAALADPGPIGKTLQDCAAARAHHPIDMDAAARRFAHAVTQRA